MAKDKDKGGELEELDDEGNPKPRGPGHAHPHRLHPAGGIKVGDLVCVKPRPGQPPSDVRYTVVDVSHDKGRLFASVANYPDPSAGVFGSFHIEDLEPADGPKPEDGPGGHPPPTEDEKKRYEAAVEHRKKVDADAQKALDAEAKRLADEQHRQRTDLRHRRAHGE